MSDPDKPCPPTVITVYVTVGNSDDKLSQFRWMCFQTDVTEALMDAGVEFHGQWYSGPVSQWQNACWCFEVLPNVAERLKAKLEHVAANYDQDSIAWAEATVTMLKPGQA